MNVVFCILYFVGIPSSIVFGLYLGNEYHTNFLHGLVGFFFSLTLLAVLVAPLNKDRVKKDLELGEVNYSKGSIRKLTIAINFWLASSLAVTGHFIAFTFCVAFIFLNEVFRAFLKKVEKGH